MTEKFAPTFVFFNENKIQKDLDDFWCRKLTLKVPITPILKIQWFHQTAVDFLAKTFVILYTYLENSTTNIAILNTYVIFIKKFDCKLLITQIFYF